MIVVRWAPPSNVIFTNPDQDNKIKNLFLDRNWVYINARNKKYKIKTRQNESTNISEREFLRLIRIYFPGDYMYNEVMSCELAAEETGGFGTFKKVQSEDGKVRWERDNYCRQINSNISIGGNESKRPLQQVLNDFSIKFRGSQIVYLNTCSPI